MLVKFHSPNCPHCIEIEDSWNSIPGFMRSKGYDANDIKIFSVNTDNIGDRDLPGWKNFTHIPTIAKINGNRAKVYDGDTDTVSIAHFIIEEYKIPKRRLTRKISHFGGKRKRKKSKRRKTR